MKTITLALQKGGVGKTSLSVTLATELSKLGKTILLDADPQGNATTWIYSDALTSELADVLNEKTEVIKAVQNTPVENLFIIPTAGLGGDLRQYQKTKASSSPYAIQDIVDALNPYFDYCIIDTSPNFDPLNEAVFLASDEILTVLQFNEFSKDGLEIFTENLRDARKRLRIPSNKAIQNKIILNAKDDRIKQQSIILEGMKQLENAGYKLFIIPVDQAFNKAQAIHVSIQDLAGTKGETLTAIDEIIQEIK